LKNKKNYKEKCQKLNPNDEDEFINNQIYKIAYRPLRNPSYTPAMDIELACPKCGNNEWVYHNRTGQGKLPSDQMKWKCTECGQWFICNKAQVTKIMGL